MFFAEPVQKIQIYSESGPQKTKITTKNRVGRSDKLVEGSTEGYAPEHKIEHMYYKEHVCFQPHFTALP